VIAAVGRALTGALSTLSKLPADELVAARYDRLRAIGDFTGE